MHRLNFILYPLICALLFVKCSSGNSEKLKNGLADSVSYTAPAAGKINKEEFDRYFKAIETFYDANLIGRGFNGGILVAKKGTVIFERYNGYSNYSKKEFINEHSAFHLASVSKTFTAMATLKLAELGKLKLDDDVSLYLPGFPYPGVTIKMLLSHRSGLPNYIYFLQLLGWDITKVSTNKDVLDYMIKFKPPLTHTPGKSFNYCNTNYALLALVIEKVSGTSYPDFLKNYFFKPLKMEDTYVFTMADSAKALPSYDWRWRPEVFNFLDGEYGDKNIYSTPRDLLKWDQALSNNQLFSKLTLEEAFTPYSNEKPGVKNYGLGWRMNIYPNGKKIIFHTGWWHGNNTILVHLIQDSVAIIVLGNKYNRVVYEAKKLANLFEPYFNTDEEEEKTDGSKGTTVSEEQPDSLRTHIKMLPKIHPPKRRHRKR